MFWIKEISSVLYLQIKHVIWISRNSFPKQYVSWQYFSSLDNCTIFITSSRAWLSFLDSTSLWATNSHTLCEIEQIDYKLLFLYWKWLTICWWPWKIKMQLYTCSWAVNFNVNRKTRITMHIFLHQVVMMQLVASSLIHFPVVVSSITWKILKELSKNGCPAVYPFCSFDQQQFCPKLRGTVDAWSCSRKKHASDCIRIDQHYHQREDRRIALRAER